MVLTWEKCLVLELGETLGLVKDWNKVVRLVTLNLVLKLGEMLGLVKEWNKVVRLVPRRDLGLVIMSEVNLERHLDEESAKLLVHGWVCLRENLKTGLENPCMWFQTQNSSR